jgi:oligopeptide/dipeptide ABC transporter ATP-binding protein
MSALIALRGVSLTAATPQGPARLLRSIDLDIARGRIMGLVGESGSGKSSLAAALLRLLPANVAPPAGSIRFDGIELAGLDEAAMRRLRGVRIAMIFQDPMTALNPVCSIGAHMLAVLRRRTPGIARRTALAEAEAMLRRVAIADPAARLAQYPHQLSGGMRQRVVIAMALLCAPDLLLADEPTTALDATVEAQIAALFASLRRELTGSMVFISHSLGLVAELCDDACVLYAGAVMEVGPVGRVLARPAHPYTRALLACELEGDGAGGRLASIPGEPPDPRSDPPGCLFAPRCTFAVDRCRTERPVLRALGSAQAACHRIEELA